MTEPAIRYPLDRLLTAAHLTDQHHLATRLGLRHDTVRHAATAGLTDRQADRWAIRLGLHPATIWPTWFQHAPGELDLPA